ncbi:MAG: hypothetical protein WC254_06215 [Candidatus Woesearchaeota archaeon]|jgi:phosphoribosylpyrophosphate synthetase
MTLPFATLEEALQRVVIPLKSGNSLAGAVRASHLLNFYDRSNRRGVIPLGDDLIDVRRSSSAEPLLTLLPEEFETDGRVFKPKQYHHDGRLVRFFSDHLGGELEGKTVYFVATPSTNAYWEPDQMVFRMQLAIRTAKRMGAEKAFAVFSEFPFARQDRGESEYSRGSTLEEIAKDRKKHGGQTDGVSFVLTGLMVNGCDGVVDLHHHSGHVELAAADCLKQLGMAERRFVYDIRPTYLIARYLETSDLLPEELKANYGEGIVFISPDQGALSFLREVREASGLVNSGLAWMKKTRLRPNDPTAIGPTELIPVDGSNGNYAGKVGITMDDIIDTFGTMKNALEHVSEEIPRFIVYSTHGIFAGDAEQHMRRYDRITDVLLLDTRPSRLRALGADAKRKVTILKPGHMLAYVLAQCVEKGIDPNQHLAELFKQNPAFFDELYKTKQFDQHYSKEKYV